MKTRRFLSGLSALTLALAALAPGCEPDPADEPPPPPRRAAKPAPPVKKVEVARNIFLEIQGDRRRVVVSSSVCLNKGQLEQLVTRKDTKEHEAVLAADIDARDLHKALLLARARPGAPVQFGPPYVAASGQVIKITLEYEKKGKVVSVRGQDWVRDASTRKALASDWVFAGSRLVQNPLDRNKPIFLANDGDLVCVSNFESALLDLPIMSSKANSELTFEAFTERIPPIGTPVTILFEPVPEKKQ